MIWTQYWIFSTEELWWFLKYTSLIMIFPYLRSCDGLSSKLKENPKLLSWPIKCHLRRGLPLRPHLYPVPHPTWPLPSSLTVSLDFSGSLQACASGPVSLLAVPEDFLALLPHFIWVSFNPHQSLSLAMLCISSQHCSLIVYCLFPN